MSSRTHSDIPTLLRAGLGPNLHWFPADVAPSRLAAVLVGMANTNGGQVLIGVSPRSGQIHGVGDTEAVMDAVFQSALLTDPPLVLPLPQVHSVEGVQLILVTVPTGLPHVYSLEGRYLGREGAQTNPIPARRLRHLLMERGVVQFEAILPPGAALADLDPQKVAAYLQVLGQPADDPGVLGEAAQEALLRRGCLKRAGETLLPTYAALLLFGRQPQQWVPSAVILAARFAGPTFADRFIKQEIHGTLPEQLMQAEAFARENIRQVVRLVGLARQETREYPLEAVRELLVNAVAHRDYNVQGDTIHLNLFSDRIEIVSPGGLPGPVNLDNLLKARFSRNAVIVQVLSDMGFVERLGYGLDRVVAVVKQNDLRPPRFEEAAGAFRVTMYGEAQEWLSAPQGDAVRGQPNGALAGPLGAEGFRPIPTPQVDLAAYQGQGLNPRQEAALVYLSRHRRITNREYQDLCPDVHSETLRRDLADLVSRGVVIKVGDKRATYYILK